MTRAAAVLALLGIFGAGVLACGRYGPPRPYPPVVEQDDEEPQP